MNRVKITAIAIVSVLFLVLCVPCTVWAKEKAGLGKREKVVLHKANKAIQNDDLQNARDMVRDFIKEQSGDVSARLFLFLGYTWYQGDEPARAREVYKLGLKHAPGNKELHRNYAIACYQTGEFELAGEHFEQAYDLSREKEDGPGFDFLYRAGSAFYQEQDYSGAKRVLQRLDSGAEEMDSDWLKLLSRVYFNLEKWKEAEEIVNRLLDREPLSRDCWKILAQCNIRQKDYAAAA